MAFKPLPVPDFGRAALALVRTLQEQPRVEDRAATLGAVMRALSDGWFPMYLKLLIVIGTGAADAARRVVADALAYGLAHGAPSGGTLTSWGIPSSAASVAPFGQGFLRMAGGRPLDPLAYLTVWYSQSTSRSPLPQALFESALAALLRLLEASPAACEVYQAKLRTDLLSAPPGAFNPATSLRLQRLLDGWSATSQPAVLAAEVARADLRCTSIKQLRAMPGQP
jgi:hypothetical protein